MLNIDLKNKVTLVVGGARGIGAAVVREAAGAGSRVVWTCLDIPEDIRRTPFRTFRPLPMYLWKWWKFTTDYRAGGFPFHASYEHILTLPDNLTPKLFEIQLHGAKKCHIYGIGRME